MTTAESAEPVAREFYDRDAVLVARELLGKLLLREEGGRASGMIVETEAYLGPLDSASHSFRGRTRRNASMFGPPGHAYVYAIHSRHCVNVVCREEGVAHAVLIRAIEPLEGQPLMRRRRGRDKPLELARGPARLCEALAIGPQLDGWDLTLGQTLWVAAGESIAEEEIAVGPRVGVTSAKDVPLRFAVRKSRFVSLPRVV